MKTFALLSLAVLAAVATTADASTTNGLRITVHHKETKPAGAKKHSALEKKFAKYAHMKATPWDGDEKLKATKCEDLCTLKGFFSFQVDRNCYNRPTGLCQQFKLTNVAMETVLITAECKCEGDDEEEASGEGSA